MGTRRFAVGLKVLYQGLAAEAGLAANNEGDEPTGACFVV